MVTATRGTPGLANGLKYPLILEERCAGSITKVVNNDGRIISNTTISKIFFAFAHYIYAILSEKTVLPLDLQYFSDGQDIILTDIEVATTSQKMKAKWAFIGGNLGQPAIQRFLATHKCGLYCKL